MQGWISLHRQLQLHWLWEDKPFSKGQAWIDILLLVNHEDGNALIGKTLVPVIRGSKITSIRQLCDRWGWSNTKIRSFLKLLEAEQMIEIKSDAQKTTLTVLKYNDYQDRNDSKNDGETTEKHHENTTKTLRKHTNNNVNKDNKNIYISVQHLSVTEDEYNKLINLYGKEIVDNKIEYARNYSKLKNYTSLYLTLNNWLKKDVKKQIPIITSNAPSKGVLDRRDKNYLLKKILAEQSREE